jgi:hypothetical protein
MNRFLLRTKSKARPITSPQKLSRLLLAPIVFQLVFGPLSYAGDNRTPLNPAPVTLESGEQLPGAMTAVISELQASQEGSLPQGTRDAFHLTHQRLEITDKNAIYDLSSLNLNLPSIVPPDFDRDVKLEIDPQSRALSFALYSKGKIIARHFLPDTLKVATVTRDKELAIIVSTRGEIFAMDMGYARSQIFSTPLPVIRLVDSGLRGKTLENLQAKFLTRGLMPVSADKVGEGAIIPLDRNADGSIDTNGTVTAGDLVLFNDTVDGRKLQGLLDRSVIKTQLYTAEAVIATLAFQVAPIEEPATVLPALSAFMKDAAVQSESVTASKSLSPAVREALASIPEAAFNSLITRANLNNADHLRSRDIFTIQEWKDGFGDLKAEADRLLEAEKSFDAKKKEELRERMLQGNFGDEWRHLAQSLSHASRAEHEAAIPKSLFHRFMTSRAMKILATVTMGGAAIYGIDSVQFGGQGAAWAVHMVNQVYNDYVPEVLKDKSYRITLLKSSLALSAFVPLMWAIGHLTNKIKGTTWTAKKMLATMGMRAYAVLMFPFWHRLAKLADQPNFIKSLQLGISPFTKVAADSSLGRYIGLQEDVRPGVNQPYLKDQKREATLAQKNQVLEQLATQKQRLQSLAWTLALVVASEQNDMDPATLALLIREGDQSVIEDRLQKLAEDPGFQKQWVELAREISMNLDILKQGQVIEEFDRIQIEELAGYYKMAKSVAVAAKSRGKVRAVLARLRVKWHSAASTSLSKLARFGVAEHEFLKAAEPSDFVVSQFWKQFVTDYLLSVGQIAVVGDRAKLSDRQALAAEEGRLLWTNPGHRYDMIDQVRIYGINVPARMSLVYQTLQPVTDSSYDPIENISLQGVEKTEGVFKGVTSWIIGAGNVHEANYGGIFMKSLSRTFKTIQANLIMSLTARMVFGGQAFGAALPAFAYGVIWGTWQYGWLWEPINRGNQMYAERLDGLKAKLANAKEKVSKGLRLNNETVTLEGTRELMELYTKSDPVLEDTSTMIEHLEMALANLTPEQIKAFRAEVKQATDLQMQLRRALRTGDENSMAQARAAAQTFANDTGKLNTLALVQLSAIRLLEHSLKTPPYAVRPLPSIEWITTGVGAFVTTLWATSMSVMTFRPDVPWSEKLIEAGLLSVGLYAATYYGQKGLAVLVKKYDAYKARAQEERKAQAKLSPRIRQPLTCEGVFSGI